MTLGSWLEAVGVTRVFGAPLAGVHHPEVGRLDDEAAGEHGATIARLLAEADGAAGNGLGAWFDGTVLHLTSTPGADPAVVTVRSATEVHDALVAARDSGVGAAALALDFDAADDATAALPTLGRDPSIAARLPADPLPPGNHTFDLVLAGSSVIRGGHVETIREFADVTGLGVLNTFTAKGMFRWDSPFHLGTAGLQLHDFALAGLSPERPILSIGTGIDECPAAILADAGLVPPDWPILQASPEELPGLASRVRAAHEGAPVLGELYHRVAAVAQPRYALDDMPLNPARAAADVAEALPDGAFVTLEPGTAGWWIARTLPTTQLGSVRVPASGRPGLAVAAAMLFALDGHQVIAVVDTDSAETELLLDHAGAHALSLVVAHWGPEGEISSPAEHRSRLVGACSTPGITELAIPIDFSHSAALIEAAGPLAAWS